MEERMSHAADPTATIRPGELVLIPRINERTALIKNMKSQLRDKRVDGQEMQKLFLDHIKYTDSTNDALKLTAQIYADFSSNASLTKLSLPVTLSFTLLI